MAELTTWQGKIPACFSGNGSFAAHPSDKDRAFELLKQLRAEDVGWKKVKTAFEDQIGPTRMAIQDDGPRIIEKVKAHFRPWILD